MKKAVGCIIYAIQSKRICLQLRSSLVTYPLTWGFWGGKSEKNEKSFDTLFRELTEELGILPQIIDIKLLDIYKKSNLFEYKSFCVIVRNDFSIKTNNESAGYAWLDYGKLPEPMHNNAKLILNKKHVYKKMKNIINNYTYDNSIKILASKLA